MLACGQITTLASGEIGRMRCILQTGTLAVRTLEGYVGDVNNIAARLLQQLGSDRLIPPSSSQTVIL